MAKSPCRAVLLIALASLAAGGCATLPSAGGTIEAVPAAHAPDASGDLAPVGTVRRGELAELAPGNALGVRRVFVAAEYRAASGRLCRRVVPANTDRFRVVCRRANGDWSATRRLSGGSATPAALAAAPLTAR